MGLTGSVVRRGLECLGYWARHRSVLPYGIEYLDDVHRLCSTYGITIKCVLDIGAYDGRSARDFITAFPGAEIHAFEPYPESFALLTKIAGIRAYQLAISDRTGTVPFYVYGASQSNSLVKNHPGSTIFGVPPHTVEVSCTTVDALCLQPDFLKIDTEGNDLAVIRGSTKTLPNVRVIYLEFNSVAELGAIGEILEPVGFKMIATYQCYTQHKPLYVTLNALFFKPDGI